MKNNYDGIVAIILSVTLPDNGASAVMKALRQNTSMWGIPVLTTIPSGDYADKMPPALETDDFVCKCHPMSDLYKRVHHLVYLAESRKQVKALHNEIFRDYLTGLVNRRGFYEALSSIRDKDLPIAVCLFDLDNLKNINNTYGHDAGDRLIQAFADILRRNTRSNDVLCRYGGDEFMVILKNIETSEAASERCAEICGILQDRFAKEQITISCSVGIAFCPNGEKPSERLVEQASQALCYTKKENKGSYYIYK